MAVILKKGESAIIEILGDDSGRGAAQQKRGLIPSRRDEDYLPRRKKNNEGWRLYDLGQWKNQFGEYNDLDYYVPIPLSFSNRVITVGSRPANTYTAKRTLILDNLAEIETNSRLVEQYHNRIFKFKLQFLDSLGFVSEEIDLETDSRFANHLLKLTDEQLDSPRIRFQTFSAFFQDIITLKGTGANRVTALPSYSSSAVSLTLSNSAKFYFVPRISWSECRAYFKVSASLENSLDERWYLNYFGLIFPRTPFLQQDGGLYDYNINDAFYDLTGHWHSGSNSAEHYRKFWQASYIHALLPNARLNRVIGKETSGSVTWTNDMNLNLYLPDEFPDYPALPTAPVNGFNLISGFALRSGLGFSGFSSQDLVMVIEQDGERYYVWS